MGKNNPLKIYRVVVDGDEVSEKKFKKLWTAWTYGEIQAIMQMLKMKKVDVVIYRHDEKYHIIR